MPPSHSLLEFSMLIYLVNLTCKVFYEIRWNVSGHTKQMWDVILPHLLSNFMHSIF